MADRTGRCVTGWSISYCRGAMTIGITSVVRIINYYCWRHCMVRKRVHAVLIMLVGLCQTIVLSVPLENGSNFLSPNRAFFTIRRHGGAIWNVSSKNDAQRNVGNGMR